jgi:hypothetical protein
MNLIMPPNYSRRSVKLINMPVMFPLHVVEYDSQKLWTNRQPETVD